MDKYNAIAKQYEDDVLSGRIPSGKLLRMAIERQRKDLKNGRKRGIYFDHEAGQDILDFADLVNIAPETPIMLAPCQVWELYVFYGWKRMDGRRRFRFKYKSCGRGNGKSPLESLGILYHLVIDGPDKAEAYVSATKEDQAKIAFNDAKNMLEYSPELQDVLKSTAETIYNPDNKAKFSFLTSNPKTADGTRPTYAVIDEYHEFDSDDMLTKLKTGLIKTDNPILDIVTTRGTDKSKPCFQAELKFYIPILKGIIENDAVFVLIYSLDDEDIKNDGKDKSKPAPFQQNPQLWYKANPMMGERRDPSKGYLLGKDDMAEALKEAKQKGSTALSGFLTLNLNMWVDAPETWIEDEVWLKAGSPIEQEDFYGKSCYGGLDLAKRDDFCSFCLLFPRESVLDEPPMFDAFWWHWIPEETIKKRIDNGLVSLPEWMEEGYIIATDGTVTDYDVIETTIKELSGLFSIEGVSYDQHNIGNLATNLTNHGLQMNIQSMAISHISEPTKQLKYALLEGRINHGFDPVMRWQISNVVEVADNNENIRITKDKKRAKEKVDGVMAAVMAMGEYITQNSGDTANVYDSRGFIEL